MDIVLKRILSLIPKKENGDYVHGAKNEFTDKIGAPKNIISQWISGNVKSYRNYIYQIAEAYNVSVEWLKGETDEKNPRPKESDGDVENAIKLLINAPEEKKKIAAKMLKAFLEE